MTKKKQKRGPEAERIAVDGDWREAVAKAVRIERPEGGWPEPEKRVRKPSKRAKKG